MSFRDPIDRPTQPAKPVPSARFEGRAQPPELPWTVHVLVGFIAGPLIGAAIFAWTSSMDLGLAALLIVIMIPVAFAVSALAMPRLIWLARFLWRGVTKGLILAAALTGWQPREAPPPNEYLLHLHSPFQALREGFFGPLNLYFRPSMIFSRHTGSFFSYAGRELQALFYVGSFAWMPVTFLVSVILVGVPGLTTLRLIGLLTGLLTLLGVVRGLGWTGAKPRRYELNPDLAWVFAIYFNSALIVDFVVFDHISGTEEVSFAQITDSPQFALTIVSPIAFGMLLGLCALFGSALGPKRLVQYGALISSILLLLLWRSHSPHKLELTFSLLAMALISTHLPFQPVYFVWSALAAWLASTRPDWIEALWRWSPVRLTEYVYVPQPGTAEVVRRLKDIDPDEAARAIRFLCHHPFQSRLGFELRREWLVEQELRPMTP